MVFEGRPSTRMPTSSNVITVTLNFDPVTLKNQSVCLPITVHIWVSFYSSLFSDSGLEQKLRSYIMFTRFL